MHISKMTLTIFTFLLLIFVSHQSMAGTDLEVDVDNSIAPYVLPEGFRNFIIERHDLVGNCESEDIKKALVDDREGDSPGILRLRRSACLYHTQSVDPVEDELGRSADSPNVKKQLAVNANAIQELSTAQQQGLPPIHQTYSSILKGIFHCRQARIEQNIYKASITGERGGAILQKAKFCASRRKAMASFSNINWNLAHFDIRDTWNQNLVDGVSRPSVQPENFSIGEVIGEYSACYEVESPLHEDFNDGCSVIDGYSDSQIRSLANSSVKRLTEEFLGENASNRVTAMFSRKKQRVVDLVDQADANIEEVAEEAKIVLDQYDKYQAAFDQHSKKADEIVKRYRESASLLSAIEAARSDWISGLFVGEVGAKVSEIIPILESIDANGMLEKAKKIQSDLSRLPSIKEERDRRMQNVCKIYYCQVKSNMAPFNTRTKNLCATEELQNNPLCSSNPVIEADHGSMTVRDICLAAGLGAGFLREKMASGSARVCARTIRL